MVLKNCGPKGYPGMAEVGNMGLPPKVLKKGVTDMVRISDARMSGTAYGTVVLHAAPEAAAGGPLALVQDGDMIELDVAGRRLHLDVSDDELAKRRTQLEGAASRRWSSGYQKLYVDHVLQADKGADLDFLVGKRGAARAAREPLSAAPPFHPVKSTPTMNVAMVGYGMMGVWHSEALQRAGATLHTAVGGGGGDQGVRAAFRLPETHDLARRGARRSGGRDRRPRDAERAA